tara:strand:- start:302 stop:487 length:186 start_codon:yes stop_codon:yes gene_type:complete
MLCSKIASSDRKLRQAAGRQRQTETDRYKQIDGIVDSDHLSDLSLSIYQSIDWLEHHCEWK